MPLFNYKCLKCEMIVEKFQHKPGKIKIVCKECGGKEFERIIGRVHNKIRLNAHETLKNKINPEVDRITENISKGKDKDFLDIVGD